MAGSQAATLAQIEPFWSWNTPIAWSGFILFADSIVWRARGSSWMRSNGLEFGVLSLVSIPLWLVFEGYNLIIRNWYYVGLPEIFALRRFGYAWPFARIWPAIFEAAELVAVWRAPTGDTAPMPAPTPAARPVRSAAPAGSVLSIATGAGMLLSPLLVPASVAPYMAAPVWL